MRRTLTVLEDTEERLMMGLRLTSGMEAREFPEYYNKFNELSEIGMLETTNGRVRTTAKGRPVLNAIVRELLS